MKSITKPFSVILAFGLIVLSILTSCQESQSNSAVKATTTPGTYPDSSFKKPIEIMVDSINAGLRRIGRPEKIPYQVYNPTDTIYFWIVDGNSARISLELSPKDETIWPTFFIYKGQLVMVRYRYYIASGPSPFASESMVYLQDGKIVYCIERRVDLQDGGAPGSLRRLPFAVSKRTPEEIEKEYSAHWRTVVSQMKEHHVWPAGIKE